MEAFWSFGQLMKQISVSGAHGLDFREFVVLTAISEGAIYPKFIGERLSINASDVSRILETLSKGGFIKRELDASDSRRVLVTLTEAGVIVLKSARARIEQLIADAENTVSSDDLEQTARTLTRLKHTIRLRTQQEPIRTDSS
jgi:DNA-binding MarR family transcriptional regulator